VNDFSGGFALSVQPAISSLGREAGAQLGVNLQDVILNPGAAGFMQGPQQLHPVAFGGALLPVSMKEAPEASVGVQILNVGGTAVAFHAFLLQLEMVVGIAFQEIHNQRDSFHLVLRGIGGMQQFSQVIDISNQQPVLKVKLRGTGFKLLGPNYWHARE